MPGSLLDTDPDKKRQIIQLHRIGIREASVSRVIEPARSRIRIKIRTLVMQISKWKFQPVTQIFGVFFSIPRGLNKVQDIHLFAAVCSSC
jgi:hypothetical protein